jgi:drug/metabolite transporter (DMT)-like permease
MTTRLSPTTLLFLMMPPLCWAGNVVLGRAMVGHIPPLALSFWRWLIAFALILPFTLRGIIAAKTEIRARWPDILVMGTLGIGTYNSFQYVALQTSSALNVTLIVASGPVFSLLVGALFFRSPVSRPQAIGAILSVTGVLWVIAHGSLQTILELRLTPGDAYMLFAITVWSFYTWLLRTRRPQIPAAPFLTIQIAVGTLAIMPFYLAERSSTEVHFAFDQTIILTLLYVSLFASLAAYFSWDRAVARTGATFPAYFVNLTPVFAAILANVFLDEKIAGFHLVGAVLIFLGIVVANRGAPRLRKEST